MPPARSPIRDASRMIARLIFSIVVLVSTEASTLLISSGVYVVGITAPSYSVEQSWKDPFLWRDMPPRHAAFPTRFTRNCLIIY